MSAVMFGSFGFSYAQVARPPRMSVGEARQFARAAVLPKLRRLPRFQFDKDPPLDNGLYVFNAIWEGLPNGSVEIGFYAVDPITGTVWNAVAGCDQISTPELRKLQSTWVKRSGFTRAALLKFQVTGPQCPTGKD